MHNKTTIQKIVATIIIITIMLNTLISLILNNTSLATENSVQVSKFANVILFVDFEDTNHDSHGTSCFSASLDNTSGTSKIFQYFNGDNEYERGLKPYLKNISYGQFEVQNIFPQYNEQAKKFVTYTAQNKRDYYEGKADLLIEELVKYINENKLISSNQNLDNNNDGCIDNFTMIIADGTQKGESSYKANYAGDSSINEKKVVCYNLLRESGVIIHEFLHTLGYPDLYRTGYPVGRWDIMASSITRVSYPLAYFRMAKTNWITIPEVTKSQTGYSIYAASRTTYNTRNNQAVILKTPYSETEFFVVEYRKQESGSNTYDNSVYGSGIIIYRINTNSETNSKVAGEYTPDVAYVFRPGDTLGENGYENGSGDINSSFLSLESGRTSYGTSDLSKSVADGAITYSDGTNSGIVISNVGSSSGDKITFDINFTDLSDYGYWNKLATKDDELVSEVASYADTNGDLYYLINNTGNQTTLYKYNSNGWSKVSNTISTSGTEYKLIKYNNSFYMAYNALEGQTYYTKLLKLNGSTFQEVYKFTNANGGNYVGIDSDETGIYFAIPNSSNTELYGYKYANSAVSDLGKIATSNYLSNTSISSKDGNVVVCYREFMNNNKINVKIYKNNSWNNLETNMSANSVMVKLNDNKIYMIKNGESTSKLDSYVYVYDLSKNNGWIQIGNAYTTENVSDMDMCFNGKVPYIIYQTGSSTKVNAIYLKDEKWTNLGKTVVNETINNLQACIYNNIMYATYTSANTKNINIKYYKVEAVKDDSNSNNGNNNNGNSNNGNINNGNGNNGNNNNNNNSSDNKKIPNINIEPYMFNATYYADMNNDLKNAFGYDETKLKEHYLTYGIKEGRQASPIFNPEYYLNKYSDLKNAFGAKGYESAYYHFINNGIIEGRQGSKYFDVQYYLNKYNDVKVAFSNNYTYGAMHFATCGIPEGRQGSSEFYVISFYNQCSDFDKNQLKTNYIKYYAYAQGAKVIVNDPINITNYMFDVDLYYSLYSDLQQAIGYNPEALKAHYLNNGIKEGRIASYVFNPEYYLNKYSDLKNAFGAKGYESAYYHFINNGINEGRQASALLDAKYYLSKNKDLSVAFGNNYSKALEHFVNCGLTEGRTASSQFDVNIYKNNNKDLVNAFGNNIKEYFKHYISFGCKENRKCV
jgi:M6 family metalloprotease-like protein